MIDKYFNHKKRGFYIDVGASHPKKLSNTKFFYDKGWHGINIEPNPKSLKLFLKDRKRDNNLNIGIGSKAKRAVFYEFEAAAFSTFSKKEATMLLKVGYKLKRKIKIKIYRLENIIKKYAPPDIDFMSVDTEGFEMHVLESNNWQKYRPKLLCIETIDFIKLLKTGEGLSARKKSIDSYLLNKGYREYFSNGLNTLYIDSNL